MQPILEDVAKKFYVHLIASFTIGFIIFLWGYGLYGMFSEPNSPPVPYILLAFTIYLIFCTVILEHRGVKMPYLLAGGSLLSFILTFITICVVNGVFWVKEKTPQPDSFLVMISVSTIAGFILLKLFTMQRRYDA
ncbi:MAG TPA: hypothetical protein EYP30_05735 [Archaeoglobaceae archaeon]|nr:hypothetical protein [Archaeoglobaceae archaeon]